MAGEQTITLRLTLQAPVAGVVYSLQCKRSLPVGQVTADGDAISFDILVRVAPGPRFLGEFVRSEGPSRRFVYIASGEQAGQRPCVWSRRAKIDIHVLPAELLDKALAGAVLEALLPGADKDGGPCCGTVPPIGAWRARALI